MSDTDEANLPGSEGLHSPISSGSPIEEPEPASEDLLTSNTPTKRSRGRPRKYPKQLDTGEPKIKRPRGRPKGSPNKDAKPKPEPTEKRPRGRPKGSYGPSRQRAMLGLGPGRGRPKKKRSSTDSGESAVKRPRGRPKGSPNKRKTLSSDESPQKRGRGRPKGSGKSPLKVDMNFPSTQSSDGSLPKRGRGRPRGSSPPKPYIPTGRPRGRPRKKGDSSPSPTNQVCRSKLANLEGRSLTATFAIEMSVYEELHCPQHKDCLRIRSLTPPIGDDSADSLREILDDIPVMLYSCIPQDHVTQVLPEWIKPWELTALDGKELTGFDQTESAVVAIETASTVRSCDSSSQPIADGMEPLQWPLRSASSSNSCPPSISPDDHEGRTNSVKDVSPMGTSSLPVHSQIDDGSSPVSLKQSKTLDGSSSRVAVDTSEKGVSFLDGSSLPVHSQKDAGSSSVSFKQLDKVSSNEVNLTDSSDTYGNFSASIEKNTDVDLEACVHRKTDSRRPDSVLVKDTPPNESIAPSSRSPDGERVVAETQEGEGVEGEEASGSSLGIRGRLMSGLAHVEKRISETFFRRKSISGVGDKTSLCDGKGEILGSTPSEEVDRLLTDDIPDSEDVGGVSSNSQGTRISEPKQQPLSRDEPNKSTVTAAEKVPSTKTEKASSRTGLQTNKDEESGRVTQDVVNTSPNQSGLTESDRNNDPQIGSDRDKISSDAGDKSPHVSFAEGETMETQPFEVDSPPNSRPTTNSVEFVRPATEETSDVFDFPETQPFEVEEPVRVRKRGEKKKDQPAESTVEDTSKSADDSSKSLPQLQSTSDSQSQSSDLPSSLLNNAFVQTQSQNADVPQRISLPSTSTAQLFLVPQPSPVEQGRHAYDQCPDYSISSEEDIFSTCPHGHGLNQTMDTSASGKHSKSTCLESSESCDEVIHLDGGDHPTTTIPATRRKQYKQAELSNVGDSDDTSLDMLSTSISVEICQSKKLTKDGDQSGDVSCSDNNTDLRKTVLVTNLFVNGQSSSNTFSKISCRQSGKGEYSQDLSAKQTSGPCGTDTQGSDDRTQEEDSNHNRTSRTKEAGEQDHTTQDHITHEPSETMIHTRTPERNEHERTPKKRDRDDFDLSLVFGTPVTLNEVNKLLDEKYSPLTGYRSREARRQDSSPNKRSRKSLVSEFVAGLQGLKCSCGEMMSEDSASSMCSSCQASPTLSGIASESIMGSSKKLGRNVEVPGKIPQEHEASQASSFVPKTCVGAPPRTGEICATGDASTGSATGLEERVISPVSSSTGMMNRKRKRSKDDANSSSGKLRRTMRKTQRIREGLLKMIIDEHAKLKKPKKLKRKLRVTL